MRERWSVGRVGNRFHFRVLTEAGQTVLTADAAVLVAAERRVRAVARCSVEPDETRTQPTGYRKGSVQRTRHHVSGEAVHAVVGDPDRIVLVVVGNDDQ